MATVTEQRTSLKVLRGLGILGFAIVSGHAAADDLLGAGNFTAAVPGAGADANAAGAPSTTHTRKWQFSPSLQLRGTATDNVDLTPNNARQSDFITEIIPGIRIDGNGARANLHLNYRMDNLIYARNSSQNELQNYLDAVGSVEVIENFFFIDGTADISQQAISPFGPRPTDSTNINSNRTETKSFAVSPYIRGRLGSAADYEARYRYSDVRSNNDATGDSKVNEFTAHLGAPSRLPKLAWRLDAQSESVESETRRDTSGYLGRGVLTYSIDPQFSVSGTAGYERNDYATLEQVGNSTYGGGFDWGPTPRTKIHANWEHRFFGGGWDFSARHRTPFMAFEVSGYRDVRTDADNVLGVTSGPAYDLLYAALTTRIPDAADRAAETLRLLTHGGIPADLGLPPGFLIGTSYVERRIQASAAFLGVRNTVTFIVYQQNTDPLGTGIDSTVPSDLTTNVDEYGASATYTHRLSGYSSLSTIGTWLRTTSTSSDLESKQWDARLVYVTQLGPRTSGSLEYRYTHYDTNSTADSNYQENALIASLLLQF